MERKWQKLVGRDKGSLTEQQTKWTATKTILIRRIYKTNSEMHGTTLTTWCLKRSWATTTSPLPAPSPGAQHDGTWYWIPCYVWPGWVSQPSCAPSWIPVKINPILAEPRTLPTPYSIPSTSCPGPHFPVDHHHFSCLERYTQISLP